MALINVVCDQAVFTSARGPTGEGYRIVAASKGLRPEEKQKITRCSPSHESLCTTTECTTNEPRTSGQAMPTLAVSFYALPTGRFCIAASRHAGAEQSGRGGQRVYTHNLIVPAETLNTCGTNPFHFVRAMPESTLDLQKLPSGGVLPSLEFALEMSLRQTFNPKCAALLPPPARAMALEYLLEHKAVVVDLPSDWLAWAEAFFVAIPAPMRLKTPFAAGLKFSAGRGHQLNLLRDDKKAAQAKASAQGLQFVTASGAFKPVASNWHSFVERLWVSGDLHELERRTTRNFEDCSPAARERIGELYNAIDAIPQTDVLPLLEMAFRTFNAAQRGAEAEIRNEYRAAAQAEIIRRLSGVSWNSFSPIWARLVEFWRNGGEAAAFAQPVISLALQSAAKTDNLAAVEHALVVANVPQGVDRDAHELMMNQVADRLVQTATTGSPEDIEKARRLVSRWQSLRPNCAVTKNLPMRSPCLAHS